MTVAVRREIPRNLSNNHRADIRRRIAEGEHIAGEEVIQLLDGYDLLLDANMRLVLGSEPDAVRPTRILEGTATPVSAAYSSRYRYVVVPRGPFYGVFDRATNSIVRDDLTRREAREIVKRENSRVR